MNTSGNMGFALVTGASGGIGKLYAERLAQRGHDLILVARNREQLGRVAARIARETRRSVEPVVADLNDPADLSRVAARLQADADITMLVNNAGVGSTATLLESDVDEMARMIALNTSALMQLTHAVAPGFVARGNGMIINIASIAAVAPELLNGVYGATKAFVLAFSQSLRHELAEKGVRVQVVLPGTTATNFWDKAGLPLEHMPAHWVMPGADMVDAALAGLDLGEFATFPSLPEIVHWDAFEAARNALGPNLSHVEPAQRYVAAIAAMRESGR